MRLSASSWACKNNAAGSRGSGRCWPSWHDHDRAWGVVDQLGGDGPRHEVTESAVAAGADHQQVSGAAEPDQHLSRVTGADQRLHALRRRFPVECLRHLFLQQLLRSSACWLIQRRRGVGSHILAEIGLLPHLDDDQLRSAEARFVEGEPQRVHRVRRPVNADNYPAHHTLLALGPRLSVPVCARATGRPRGKRPVVRPVPGRIPGRLGIRECGPGWGRLGGVGAAGRGAAFPTAHALIW